MSKNNNLKKENQIILLWNKERETWVDSTNDIGAIYQGFYYGKFTGYNVYFKSGGKFFYSANKVQLHMIKSKIDLEDKEVFFGKKLINAYEVYDIDNNTYLVKSSEGIIISKNIKVKEDLSINKLKYFKELGLYAEKTSKEGDPLYLLGKKYLNTFVNNKSVLRSYLGGEFESKEIKKEIIVPFEFNQSKLKAIESAMKNNISIIEGPPGTGKTQTILNLIANIIVNKETCAVISNNNAAIENIYDKLIEEDIQFVAAKLGSYANVEEFFLNISDDKVIKIKDNKEELIDIPNSKIRSLHFSIKRIQEKQIEVAKLNERFSHLQVEKNNFSKQEFNFVPVKSNLTSNDYKKLNLRLENPKRIKLFERWIIKRKYKINIKQYNLIDVILSLESLFYSSKERELKNEIERLKQEINEYKVKKPEENLKALSINLFKSTIYNHYKNQALIDFNKSNYKYDYNAFIRRFPILLSTSHSILNNAPADFLFDYLIIDEASQSDLLSTVLSMNVAKNLVVVGDSKQLQQINEELLVKEASHLAFKYKLEEGYRYEKNSILSSLKSVIKDVPTTLLKEHYRSVPDIIEFCNKMFYDNELISMRENTDKHINIIKTVKGNHARKNPYGSGMYNNREIDEIKMLVTGKDLSNIGVISPFRYQANLIREKFKETALEADTVHKFQGRQKDEIILSFVVNDLETDPGLIENKLFDFVTNKDLLNVAISRAKNYITIIVSDNVYFSKNNIIRDFINYTKYLYGDETITESKIVSVFDYLYEEYKEERVKKFKENKKMYLSENLMYDLIEEALKAFPKIGFTIHYRLSKLINKKVDLTENELKYVLHPWAHVDFLFYNKITKESLFVIEVDGIKYHEQSIKQLNKDEIKDRALQQNNIDVYRFKTNESNEKERLNKILSKYVY